MIPALLASGATTSSDPLIVDLVIILAAAGLVAVIAHRLRLATVPAYLITGALIGPGMTSILFGPEARGLLGSDENLRELASLSIVLLMFGIGMHFNLSVLRGNLRSLLLAASGSILATVLVLWPLALLAGAPGPEALVVAMAFSLSSTAVVMRILQQKRQVQRMSGRLSLAILVVQDLAVIAMLMLLPPIAGWAGIVASEAEPDGSVVRLLLRGVLACGGIALLLVVGRLVLPIVLRQAARTGSGEVLMVVSVAFAMGAAAATTQLGLSAELGAFLGGFLLSSTPFRHYLSGQIGTLRDLFIAIFFTILGTAIDPVVIWEHLPTVLIGAVVLLTVKAAIIGGAAWAVGATAGVAFKVGLSLSQAGEFTLVLLSEANSEAIGVVSEDFFAKATAITVISLILTPSLIDLADRVVREARLSRIAPWVRSESLVDADERRVASEEVADEESRKHVVVAGYGVVGRAVVERLAGTRATVTIIEMNVATVRTQRGLGKSIIFGDVSDPEVLESAGIFEAEALVLTIPDEDAVLRSCRVAKQMNPGVFVIARTNFLSRALIALNLGADETVVEEMATAEAMDRLVLRALAGRVGSDADAPDRPEGDPADPAAPPDREPPAPAPPPGA